MDVRNSKLVVAVAIVFSAVVSIIAYFATRDARQARFEFQKLASSERENDGVLLRRYVYDSKRIDQNELQSVQRLQDLLHARTRLLEIRQNELSQTHSEHQELRSEHQRLQDKHRQLQSELDHAQHLLSNRAPNAPESDLEDAVTDEPEVANANDAGVPRDSLDESAASELDIDLVQWQLDQANSRIEELELSVVREILRSAEATRALIATGEAAVDPLVDLLADDNEELRVWAATVLGQIGPPASLAEDALIQALADPNARVRSAARSALASISDES